jgi:hypothetical protein
MMARDPIHRNRLTELAKSFLIGAVELERHLALMAWPHQSRVDAPSKPDRSRVELLAEADRLIAESERIVDGWRDLIERQQQEGQDVTVARDLLRTLNETLEEHRRSRDQIERCVAQRHH